MTDLIPTKVHNLIIVDESGSMECIRKQAFSGMNETLQTVRMMQKKYPNQIQYVTLITFDSDNTKLHYDNTLADKTTDLNWKAYHPCAATPLYDAIGKGISKVNAQVEDGDHVLVTIITDGYENCSVEWTLKMVRTLIESLRSRTGPSLSSVLTTLMWRRWPNRLPSRSIWNLLRTRKVQRKCSLANVVVANATTAAWLKLHQCL